MVFDKARIMSPLDYNAAITVIKKVYTVVFFIKGHLSIYGAYLYLPTLFQGDLNKTGNIERVRAVTGEIRSTAITIAAAIMI